MRACVRVHTNEHTLHTWKNLFIAYSKSHVLVGHVAVETHVQHVTLREEVQGPAATEGVDFPVLIVAIPNVHLVPAKTKNITL